MWHLNKYRAIAYLPTPYALLQYYLLEPYKAEDTLFFIHDGFPKAVSNRIPGAILLSGSSKWAFRISSILIRFYACLNRKMPVYLGGDLTFTNLFLECFDTVFYMEDGTASYVLVHNTERQTKQRNESMMNRWLYGNWQPWYGLAECVRKVYLTGILPIPEIIADKVELIDLELLWQQKDSKQKENIQNIFVPKDLDKTGFDNCKVLLLTQPFSEDSDGYFSESDKIEVYRKLVAGYDESEVLIKVHPREITDYSHYFPRVRILRTTCPMELLMLLGLSVQRAVSVNSTAIFNLNQSVEKIISGYNVTPALAEEAKRRGI
ncbi:glycosyltransferase family 52 [Parabacteroides sp.]